VVVDAPPIFGDRLLAAIREKTDEAITHVVYTHPHPDHIGLAGKLPAGIEVIASDATASELRAAAAGPRAAPFGAFVGGGPVPPPTRTFSERLSLQVGRQRLELTTLDFAAHSIGDTFVYLPRQKVLMAVDAVWPGWVPFEGLGEATDVGGYRRMLARIRDVDFELLVAGHVGRLGTKDDVDTTIEYVDDLERNVIKALGGVDFAAVGQRVGYSNTFLLVEAYFDEVARRASEDTLKKWRGRLGGADVWTYKHALKMLMWVRLH
jgi:glyoxylase-like metal-dependent hydrolase (beta-lactamase superfamily II)